MAQTGMPDAGCHVASPGTDTVILVLEAGVLVQLLGCPLVNDVALMSISSTGAESQASQQSRLKDFMGT